MDAVAWPASLAAAAAGFVLGYVHFVCRTEKDPMTAHSSFFRFACFRAACRTARALAQRQDGVK
jgi:hypothetical protein